MCDCQKPLKPTSVLDVILSIILAGYWTIWMYIRDRKAKQ